MTTPDAADVYRQEAGELLDSLEGTLLDLDKTPADRDLIDTAFRALHTIKGSGAMFGFDRVAAFTHDFETVFDLVRKGKVAVSRELLAVALAAKDHIRTLIEAPEGADELIGEAILGNLQGLVAPAVASGSGSGAAAHPMALASPTLPPAAIGVSPGRPGWHIVIRFQPDVLRNGTNPLALLDDLRELGPCAVAAITSSIPELQGLDPQDLLLGWTVDLISDCPISAIEDVFLFVLDEMTLEVEPLVREEMPSGAAPTTTAPPAASQPPSGSASGDAPATPPAEAVGRREYNRRAEDKGSSVRVPAERLDELMDRVGELVIAQARLSQLAHARTDFGIKAIAEEIERLASGLRDTTMGIRMVPIGSLFGRFRRLVHDLSRDLDKPVELVTSGEDTELDKTVIERLADPMVHLIRNAIDHGIETQAGRAGTPKPSVGRIELLAEHIGAQVLITVRDDGRGLDVGKIRAKAEDQGLIQPGCVMSDQDLYQLLFYPGFSTAQSISALSGRGVGMDVVKRTIESLRGTIELATTPGQGSSVALRLPLTLAIIEGLLIRVGEGRYVIPLSAIEECVELPAHLGQASRSRSFLDIRGDLVPFLRLRDLFEEDGRPDEHQKVIITSVGDTRVGLVADQIIGSHQTVIKSLSKLHADVTMFSGATILGDGAAALILDVAQLVAAGQAKAEGERLGKAA